MKCLSSVTTPGILEAGYMTLKVYRDVIQDVVLRIASNSHDSEQSHIAMHIIL